MKGFLRILLYFFTWQSVITAGVVFGALMVVLALNASLLSPYVAFSFSLLAYLGLLAMPCITSPMALRCLISSRNLSIIPYFSLKAGLAVLLLTLMTAAFMPLAGWLLARPGMNPWFGPKIFIVASLYSGAMQFILPSKRAIAMLGVLPFALMLISKYLGLSLLTLAADNTVVATVTLAMLSGWSCGLWRLARQQTFKPMFKSVDTAYSQNIALQGAGKFFGRDLTGKIPAAASLLFAYPAIMPIRIVNIGAWIVLWPLMSTVAMTVLAPKAGETSLFPTLLAYLGFSFLMGCLCSMSVGELGARARLLWLRLPGGRPQVWRKLEQELWTNFGLLVLILLLNVITVRLINPEQAYLQHYVLIVLICAVYDSYRTLCSRLYQWSSLVQALVMIASLLSIIGAVYYSARHGEFNVVILLEAGLLLLALLFRTFAKWQFSSVDWLVLKHEISRRTAAT